MQNHYVCPECGYTSKLPGSCQNETCIRFGVRLSECHCETGKHEMVMNSSREEAGDDIAEQEKEARENGYATNTLDLDNEDSQETL